MPPKKQKAKPASGSGTLDAFVVRKPSSQESAASGDDNKSSNKRKRNDDVASEDNSNNNNEQQSEAATQSSTSAAEKQQKSKSPRSNKRKSTSTPKLPKPQPLSKPPPKKKQRVTKTRSKKKGSDSEDEDASFEPSDDDDASSAASGGSSSDSGTDDDASDDADALVSSSDDDSDAMEDLEEEDLPLITRKSAPKKKPAPATPAKATPARKNTRATPAKKSPPAASAKKTKSAAATSTSSPSSSRSKTKAKSAEGKTINPEMFKKGNVVPDEYKNMVDEAARSKFIESVKVIIERQSKKGGAQTTEAQDLTRATPTKDSSVKYTPLEQQVIALKKKYPDVILLVEVGYNFRFFGTDAEVASRVLGIVAFKGKHFLNASIPTYRLGVHLRRIVNSGYKAAIVKQTETAAVKAVESTKSKTGPFSRDLDCIYTKSTMIIEDKQEQQLMDVGSTSSCGHLVSVIEHVSSTDRVKIAIVAVEVSTGEILYDEFEDNFMRRELETRMCKLDMSEIILPKQRLSEETERCLEGFIFKMNGDHARVERLDKALYHAQVIKQDIKYFFDDDDDDDEEVNKEASSTSPSKASQQSQQKSKKKAVEESDDSDEDVEMQDDDSATEKAEKKDKKRELKALIEKIQSFPDQIVVCLGVILQYLKQFKLESVLKLGVHFHCLSSQTSINLNAITLRNLEILQNNVDSTTKGTLYGKLNKTSTAFGARLLKSWLCHPLYASDKIKARLDAVEEISANKFDFLKSVHACVCSLPDLEKSLMRVYYKKCSPKELLQLLQAFEEYVQLLVNFFNFFLTNFDFLLIFN